MRFSALFPVFCAAMIQPAGPAQAQDALVGFDSSSFGRAVLSRNQSAGAGDIELELSVGDYNNEAITNYSPDSVFAKMGLSVGRLDILTDAGVFPCTAFIVDNKHILTNYHCVPGILDNERAQATRIESVMFVAGYTQQGIEEGTTKFPVKSHPVEAHQDLDYALLEVMGNPSAQYGTLKLAANTPHDGDPYWVIGHPMGEAQRISREKCRANRPALSGSKLLHTCDTLPGNSGSPVIDASLQAVVGLHHAGSRKDAVNFAIPMAAIIERSNVLVASLGTDTPVPAPQPDTQPDPQPQPQPEAPKQPETQPDPVAVADPICDALYAEAKSYNQCFAYEVYLEQCDSHPLSILAKGFVAAECSDLAEQPADPITPQPQPPVQANLRPWCGNGGLNAAESAICADPYLAGLDEEIELAYGRQSHVSAREQSQWRMGTRDACGGDTGCLGRVMIQQVTYLQTAPAPTTGTRRIAGNYTLGSSQCYVVTASRPTLSEAAAFAREWFPSRGDVRIFESNNGYFAVVLATISKGNADAMLADYKARRSIPSDSYCSTGGRFVAEIIRSGATAPAQKTMYVGDRVRTGLNLRQSPSTNGAIITEVPRGDAVTVLSNSNGWAQIRTGAGLTGWVSASYLSNTRPPAAAASCTARVINLNPYSNATRANGSGFLNLRSKASTKGTILSEAYLGDSLQVVSQTNSWAQVRCISGQCNSPYRGTGGVTGWASKRYLSIRCQ
ncbi:SH3 domain-containing protein [Tropicibacter naphthalenivorans]|uniref:SH3 domain protein n=1 Tax=Tropicibacter naphthalenivorans TaxID=441103 RepID=A0A0P1G0N3_9RHOB|nr:SH3 domain-containing protein [Tropicibacter naphthalenivorans]CUH75274.1 SH3 domain protein [Tropicibacter naphthalenivorans]SMC45300.1 SH3 domain-containing protein [Tropicibacter naphthalenivorans]